VAALQRRSLARGKFRDFDRRVMLDNPAEPDPSGIVRLDGEERPAPAHHRAVTLGIVLDNPEIALDLTAVAPVAGDDADIIRPDARLDQLAEGAVRRSVIMKLRYDHVVCHRSSPCNAEAAGEVCY